MFDSTGREAFSNATRKLWALDPLPCGFEYAKDQLFFAGAVGDAAVKVTRKYDEYLGRQAYCNVIDRGQFAISGLLARMIPRLDSPCGSSGIFLWSEFQCGNRDAQRIRISQSPQQGSPVASFPRYGRFPLGVTHCRLATFFVAHEAWRLGSRDIDRRVGGADAQLSQKIVPPASVPA